MPPKDISVETLTHRQAKRLNIPTAEFESVMRPDEKAPVKVAFERRNRDLDPQLVWRGKDEQDWSDLIVQAPPLYIQEKVHPKVLIDDLKRESRARAQEAAQQARGAMLDLFADFNGLADKEAATEFYQHTANWTNRMILGDSLAVMASLAEREGLRGQVQCIYFDPPYGIKFNSNFQWSTTSRDVKDGNREHITREPEQVKAFRDTWRDGIHSYLTYLRDRLTVARDLLTDSGSVFVQIGDENVHRVRALMDEVFGEDNCVAIITVQKAGSTFSQYLGGIADFVLWYGKSADRLKYRELFAPRAVTEEDTGRFTLAQIAPGQRVPVSELDRSVSKSELVAPDPLQSASMGREKGEGAASWFPVDIAGQTYRPTMQSRWKTNEDGMRRLIRADRVIPQKTSIRYARKFTDFSVQVLSNIWTDLAGAADKVYVVQTSTNIVQRCLLMATDPGDLVLDPTCGSGTTAYVAEQWGRRWITIDTSRVALALARARIMGARYPYYLLADSAEGLRKEAEVTRSTPKDTPTHGDIRLGFVYERVPHITLKSIANDAEIDAIWDKWREVLDPLRARLNEMLGTAWQEWEIPRELPPGRTQEKTPAKRMKTDINGLKRIQENKENEEKTPRKRTNADINGLERMEESDPSVFIRSHPLTSVSSVFSFSSVLNDASAEDVLSAWWQARIQRQKDIDASIAAKADSEYLYDKPYTDTARIRVAGPFTVESLSPHRVLTVGADEELIHSLDAAEGNRQAGESEITDFAAMVLENLRAAGVQQAHKQDRITFSAVTGWPGAFIAAEGRYVDGEGGTERRAGIFIGPEFGTVSRPDLVAAAREAGDAGFDLLIACAFNFDAHSAEFTKLGRIPVLKARMNPDLHMADDLKATGAGNLFVVFGEPDIDILTTQDNRLQVRLKGVDVFHPSTGEIESGGPDTIAVWFIDTDYNEESFFVRHAYFLGANDPYKALKTSLKAEIDADAWASLNSDTSRPFAKPSSGRIAVKVINHLGDEVMKVFSVG